MVRWEVAHDEQFTRLVQSGQAQAVPELAHSVHVEVPGLAADRWYFYRFMAETPSARWGEPVPFRQRAPPWRGCGWATPRASAGAWLLQCLAHMREENLDAVMFLGDYIYEYPGAGRAVRQPTAAGC